ncbi:hypothetical protein HD554DRAFT_337756 [Boletus coccyginus]|nr:hypothetical protein HD554DRAFT_337756 [Boletus coccyginus]
MFPSPHFVPTQFSFPRGITVVLLFFILLNLDAIYLQCCTCPEHLGIDPHEATPSQCMFSGRTLLPERPVRVRRPASMRLPPMNSARPNAPA